MISLQSERIASDSAVPTERVITSLVAQESAEDVEMGQGHGSSFDQRDNSDEAQEIMID